MTSTTNPPGALRLHPLVTALTLLCSTLLLHAQGGPGNKPESMAEMHSGKPKTRSNTLNVALGEKNLLLSPGDLAGMPHQTVTVMNGHTKKSETYSGVPVSALLERLGAPFTRQNEHSLLRTVLIAEGTDGYTVVLSTYETLASIRGQDAVVADALSGEPLEADGAYKLVIPGDSRPQRWVQNLKSLTFKTIE